MHLYSVFLAPLLQPKVLFKGLSFIHSYTHSFTNSCCHTRCCLSNCSRVKCLAPKGTRKDLYREPLGHWTTHSTYWAYWPPVAVSTEPLIEIHNFSSYHFCRYSTPRGALTASADWEKKEEKRKRHRWRHLWFDWGAPHIRWHCWLSLFKNWNMNYKNFKFKE